MDNRGSPGELRGNRITEVHLVVNQCVCVCVCAKQMDILPDYKCNGNFEQRNLPLLQILTDVCNFDRPINFNQLKMFNS